MLARLRHLGSRVLPGAIGGLIVLAALSATVVFGSDHDTVYYACVDNRNGTLYQVSDQPPSRCRIGDHMISWSQTGPEGEPGQPGAPGEPGLSNYRAEYGDWVLINQGSEDVAYATCPDGKLPVSGGYDTDWEGLSQARPLVYRSFAAAGTGGDPDYNLPQNAAIAADRYGWVLSVRNPHATDSFQIRAIAYCADVAASE